MDGLHEFAAGGVPLQVGEKIYRLKVLKSKVYAEAELFLIGRLPNPIQLAKSNLEGLDIELKKYLLGEAFKEAKGLRRLPLKDVLDWLMNTAEGTAFVLWQSLKANHHEFTFDGAYQLLDIAGPQQVQQALDLLWGLPAASGGKPTKTESIPWRTICRALSEKYGWTPEQIGEMTIAQIFAYYTEEEDEADKSIVRASSREEADEAVAQRRQEIEQHLAEA